MKKRHLLTFLGLMSVMGITSAPAFANPIIKCTDSQGVISYHNTKDTTKGLNCNGTNLATIDKRNKPVEKMVATFKNSGSNSTNSLADEKISSYEQDIRNQKKIDLLRNELNQERKQLALSEDMLNKLSKGDDMQRQQIEAMKKSHQNNINTLEKELKLDTTDFTNLKATAIPGLGIIGKNNNGPKFQIEGVDIDSKVNPPKQLDTKASVVNPNSVTPPNKDDKSNGFPSLENMKQKLDNMKMQREGKSAPEKDPSQHIEIKRRELPGVNISQATLNYQPLPTPLSVPDFNIGK